MNDFGYSERFIKCLATPRNFNRFIDNSVDFVINLTFQDESSYYDEGQFNPSIPLPPPYDSQYLGDITELRNLITSIPYTLKGVAYAVTNNSYPTFQTLTQTVFVNAGIYSPPLNVSDYYLTNFNYSLNITDGGTAEYYSSLIIATLNSLGVVTPGC
jgi:hypothetical protein